MTKKARGAAWESPGSLSAYSLSARLADRKREFFWRNGTGILGRVPLIGMFVRPANPQKLRFHEDTARFGVGKGIFADLTFSSISTSFTCEIPP